MTTRITAKIWTAEDAFTLTTTTIPADVDYRTGRLIGLGLLFDAGHWPGRDSRVEVVVKREGADPLGVGAMWREVNAAMDAVGRAAREVVDRARAEHRPDVTIVPTSEGWWWRQVTAERWDPVQVVVRSNGRHAGKLVHGPTDHVYDVVTDDGRWGGPCLRSDSPAASAGIAGAVADVREFHLAAMEGNPHALLHERTETPALVRAWSRYRLLKEYVQAGVDTDIAGVLDALIDVVYVAIGTGLIQFGGDRFQRAWKAVHQSNMAKRWPDGKFRIREDGKIEKPPGWVGPDIAAIVRDGACA